MKQNQKQNEIIYGTDIYKNQYQPVTFKSRLSILRFIDDGWYKIIINWEHQHPS